MRVYFVNHSAATDHLGGSEKSLLQLIAQWQAIDPALEPVAVTPSRHGVFAAEVLRRRWRLLDVRFGGWALFDSPGGRPEAIVRMRRDAAATRRLIESMTRDRPALVVTNTLVAPWAAFAAASVGVPHVWFVREFGDSSQGFHFPGGRDQALRDIGRLSVRVFANSHAVREALVPFISEDRISVNYPIVDADDVRRRALDQPSLDPFPVSADLRVVVLGRVTRSKGQWRVIEAIGKLERKGVRIAVCFVGATVERHADAALRKRAEHLGVSDLVTFAGEHANPFPFVRAADLAVVPSDIEAFGRATLECLVLGRPVIATSSGGTTEVVLHGKTGFLFAPDSVAELCEHLEAYITEPALLRTHGLAAVDRAAEVIGATPSQAQVVQALREAAEVEVAPLPAAITDLWELPEMIASPVFSGLLRLTRVRQVVLRILRIARNPLAAYRRWRLRKASTHR